MPATYTARFRPDIETWGNASISLRLETLAPRRSCALLQRANIQSSQTWRQPNIIGASEAPVFPRCILFRETVLCEWVGRRGNALSKHRSNFLEWLQPHTNKIRIKAWHCNFAASWHTVSVLFAICMHWYFVITNAIAQSRFLFPSVFPLSVRQGFFV